MTWKLRGSLLLLTGALAAMVVLAVGCGDDQTPLSPAEEQGASVSPRGPVLSVLDERVRAVMEVQQHHTPALMSDSEVVGTAVGLNEAGNLAVKVYVTEHMNQAKLPRAVDGIPVVVVESGRLVARMGGGMMGTGTDPRAIQTPPIKLGTSGGWRFDIANGFCCGGTLGGLIQIGGTQHVLSNYHVLYADTVPPAAQPGDPVIQPGLIDVGCNANNAQDVATLVAGGGSLPGNNIDAGIAAVIPNMVDPSGAILDIGTLSSSTVAAFVGQDLKKMGRTTGLSRGTVDGINGTVSITYEDECAGSAAFTQTFTGQIIITNNRCRFLDGGDSGSLAVEDVTTNPGAVGLLYAGSVVCNRFAIAIANPIDEVLSFYGASMVGVP